jgi:outer membrane protein OmpA-like peptidoglycan-associated protein
MKSLEKNTIKIGRYILIGAIGASMTFTLPSCHASRKVQGGVIGATGGAAIGGLIGHHAGNTAVGAIIGAAVGGTAGVLIGHHMDKQAEELQKDLEGATVQRVGEGILITFNEGMNFDVNSYTLPASGRSNLSDLAEVLLKYEDTDVLIEGHTDNTGSDSYNLDLSEKRAESAKKYLISQGINVSRLNAVGYGEEQPISDNSTDQGRKENRRVEVAIYANEKMKKAAKRGEL